MNEQLEKYHAILVYIVSNGGALDAESLNAAKAVVEGGGNLEMVQEFAEVVQGFLSRQKPKTFAERMREAMEGNKKC